MSYSEITINGQQIKLIPLGDCACGCGGKTALAKRNHKGRWQIKGQPLRFIQFHHQRGKNNNSWNGGIKNNSDGYVQVRNISNKNYQMQHVLIAEKVIGKCLPPMALVHHHDGNTSNNEPSNLVICQDAAYHQLLHMRKRALTACGHVDWLKCGICKQYDDPKNLSRVKGNQPYHKRCAAKRKRDKKCASS